MYLEFNSSRTIIYFRGSLICLHLSEQSIEGGIWFNMLLLRNHIVLHVELGALVDQQCFVAGCEHKAKCAVILRFVELFG